MKFLTAEFISYIFHPVVFFLLMPFLIVYRHTQDSMSALRWEMFSVAFILVMGMLFLFEKRKGVFSDIDLTKRKERYLYYAILLLLGFLYISIALYFKGVFFPMSLIAIGLWVGVGVFDFFNQYIKASNHIAVAVAFAITVGILYGTSYFFISLLIIPVLAWSRFFLHKHTVAEMIAGGVLGSLITLSTFFIGKAL